MLYHYHTALVCYICPSVSFFFFSTCMCFVPIFSVARVRVHYGHYSHSLPPGIQCSSCQARDWSKVLLCHLIQMLVAWGRPLNNRNHPACVIFAVAQFSHLFFLCYYSKKTPPLPFVCMSDHQCRLQSRSFIMSKRVQALSLKLCQHPGRNQQSLTKPIDPLVHLSSTLHIKKPVYYTTKGKGRWMVFIWAL